MRTTVTIENYKMIGEKLDSETVLVTDSYGIAKKIHLIEWISRLDKAITAGAKVTRG